MRRIELTAHGIDDGRPTRQSIYLEATTPGAYVSNITFNAPSYAATLTIGPEEGPPTVWVLMAGHFPAGVFTTKAKAEAGLAQYLTREAHGSPVKIREETLNPDLSPEPEIDWDNYDEWGEYPNG